MALTRRRFIQGAGAASLAALANPRAAFAAGYRVGVGRDSNGYAATQRALAASGEWPAVAGRTVIIKPNLVSPLPSTSGLTTDPAVVQAIVDRALADGASQILIVEASPTGAHFTECGYDVFNGYDPQGRVQLVDLGGQSITLTPVPGGGLAYGSIYMPDVVMDPTAIVVSVGKMKTHTETLATLSSKNLFGLPGINSYIAQPDSGRFAMHDRGVNQAIVDLNQVCRIDYAVIDGIWAMQGAGPLFGTPIQMNTVLAGLNAVAVDRVALAAMQIPQQAVRHLVYAARFGLGPADLSTTTIAGDPLQPVAFQLPIISPVVEYPRVLPPSFRPSAGDRVAIALWYGETCMRRIEIVQLHDDSTQVDVVRTISDYSQVAAGYEWSFWDGRDDAGVIVAPGRWTVHVRCYSLRAKVRHSDAVTPVTVNA